MKLSPGRLSTQSKASSISYKPAPVVAKSFETTDKKLSEHFTEEELEDEDESEAYSDDDFDADSTPNTTKKDNEKKFELVPFAEKSKRPPTPSSSSSEEIKERHRTPKRDGVAGVPAHRSLQSITDIETGEDDEYDPYLTSRDGKKIYDTKETNKKLKKRRSQSPVDDKDKYVKIPAVDYKFRTNLPLNCHISKTIKFAIEEGERLLKQSEMRLDQSIDKNLQAINGQISPSRL